MRSCGTLPFSDRLGSGEIATEVGQTNGWSEAQTLRAKEYLTSHRETIRTVSSQIQSLAAVILSARFRRLLNATEFCRQQVIAVEAFAITPY